VITESQLLKLSEIVKTVEEKFPVVMYLSGGSRAREAVEIIQTPGKLVKVGVTHGLDYWRIGTHTASIAGGGCTCSDESAYVDGKKFCKHRLAAMFMVKLNGSPDAKLTKLFESAEGDEIVLRLFVLHALSGDKFRLEGHRFVGQNWVRYERNDFVDFASDDLDRVLSSVGWEMSQRPVKQPSMYFHYFFVRGNSIGLFPSIIATHAAAEEKRIQQKHFEEIGAIQDLVNA